MRSSVNVIVFFAVCLLSACGPVRVGPFSANTMGGQLCEESVRDRIEREYGLTEISFGYSDFKNTNGSEEEVEGDAVVYGPKGGERLTYTCTYNYDRSRVARVSYNIVGRANDSDAPRATLNKEKEDWDFSKGSKWDSIAMCQREVQDRIWKDDRSADLRFGKADVDRRGKSEENIRGSADVQGYNLGKLTYECRVDADRGRISSINYRFQDQYGLSGKRDSIDLCHSAVRDRIWRDWKTTDVDFRGVSKRAKGAYEDEVRGRLSIKAKSGVENVRYTCTVEADRNLVVDVSFDTRGIGSAS